MWPYVHCICVITPTLQMISQPPYVWSHIQYTYDISYPLYLCHYILYVWQHNSVCGWYHIRHMCDIICTTHDITSTLSHQATILMVSHPLQAWHHTPSIRHFTHCIFVITTSLLITQALLNDITPTFCVTSYALYRPSHPILTSSHYCTYDITTSIYQTTSSM